MKTNKTLSIFMAFITIFIIGFFTIGFAGSVNAPTNATALAQYNNLSDATEISATGLNATMIVIIAAMVLSAVMFFASMLKRRR